MAKIHWTTKPDAFFPETTVPDKLVNEDIMVKDARRFADSDGWDMGCSITTAEANWGDVVVRHQDQRWARLIRRSSGTFSS